MFGTPRFSRSILVPLLAMAVLAACGDDDGGSVDAAATIDSASPVDSDGLPDAAPGVDASMVDGAVGVDGMPAVDGAPGPDADPNACHGLGFGTAAVTLQQVGGLPTMTGGAIPLGAYDAVEFKMITSTFTGTYRASWYFQTAASLESLDQIALNGGTPPTPVPRTNSYTAAGTTLTRVRNCGGAAETFTNQYSVRTDTGGTFLDVRQNNIMFTFKKRP